MPLGSGTWQVEGVPGLYLRARAKSKSFFLQRRVNGELLNRTIRETSMKDAREEASKIWPSMKHQKRASHHVTFAQAFESYMEQATLAEATIKNYRINFKIYLAEWHDRPVSDIGTQREDLRFLHQSIRKRHRESIANQCRRLLSTIYNYHRDGSNDDTLPAFPKKAVPLFSIPARDWAFDDDQLRRWWHATIKTKAGNVERGVSTLSLVKRIYWLTSLFTGARPRSIENLKWADIDFEKRAIRFRVTKGERPYMVPMSDPEPGRTHRTYPNFSRAMRPREQSQRAHRNHLLPRPRFLQEVRRAVVLDRVDAR
jgi:integrase